MLNQKEKRMKKILLSILTVAVALPALAGGLMTNTNQSASFLRSIARGTSLDPDAVLHNPAGVVFMENGWHFGISDQMAYQTRSTESTFAPFAQNAANPGQMTNIYEGDVFSPLIPSFHLAWKKNRWAIMIGMGVNGGGGTIEYDKGLASFERRFSVLPGEVSHMGQSLATEYPAYAVSADRYSMDMYLKGKSLTLAFNVGAAFRITDWLSVAAQLRVGVTSNAYEGYMKNIAFNPTMAGMGLDGQMIPASYFFQQAAAMLGQINPDLGLQAAMTADHILDVKQKGTSFSPVVALSFHKGKWDATVKYEFKMGTELEIESAAISANDPVINGIFPNGAKVKAETPALLAVAASRQCGPVKVTLEWHHYFDKDAENSFSQAIKGNTNEYLAGLEYQVAKRWLISLGVQRTQYNLYEAYYSDMNFSTPSTSVGLGLKFNITDAIALNAGFMKTFYEDVTNSYVDATNPLLNYTDIYSRTSTSWAIGLDFKFGKK